MFESATLKLTGWYLLIIVIINLIFSIVIYETTTSELSSRLQTFGQGIREESLPSSPFSSYVSQMRDAQTDEAKRNIILNLLYSNVIILIAGGFGAYILARRTLRPIEEAHQAQSRFTSDASHELRTPLAAMKAELEASLRDPHLSKTEMRELLVSNLEEVDKLTSLSQTLLKLAQQDYKSLERTNVDFTAIVERVLQTYDKAGTRLNLSAPSKPVFVYGHAPSLEELCTILVDNALKYSPGESPIPLVLSVHDGKARLDITNAGAGIPTENLPHIFERFYRADNARSGNGHGLGLSIAKIIVELHHGGLSATSAAGHETTFTVLLPLYKSVPIDGKITTQK